MPQMEVRTYNDSLTFESFVSTEERIDRQARLIRGVKVIGFESGNSARTIGVNSDENYRYTKECLAQAVPLYEGISVFIDHPDFDYLPSGERVASRTDRKLRDKFGKLINVRVGDSGLFADLAYLDSHPLSQQVIEMAERMPEMMALSHHAYTRPRVNQAGEVLVEKIESVESVDLIGEKPGTTKSLFESEAKSMTLNESQPEEQATTAAPTGENEAAVTPAEEPAPMTTETEGGGDPAQVVAGAFKQKIIELVNTVTDEGELKKKVAALVKAMNIAVEAIGDDPAKAEEPAAIESEGEAPGEEEKPPAAESEGGSANEEEKPPAAESETAPEDEKASATTESLVNSLVAQALKTTKVKVDNKLIEENNRLRKREDARLTLESAGVYPNGAYVEALATLTDEKLKKQFVESLPKNTFGSSFPRSQAPVVPGAATIESGKEGAKTLTAEEIAAKLRGGPVI